MKWYIERGRPVKLLCQWNGKGPRNVLIERVDGSQVIRSFRGLRRTVRCDNCTRERLAVDVFWHASDENVYCVDVFACEVRLDILARRYYAARSLALEQVVA